ncbi:MAG: MogA/MoaB family molybdenum cofactor biosynthesis protein [Candidatus Bathyarchaeota archaeon]|nr:MogA/MoaB family molybdenum cofactor biosynthesis protein [Candidatus Bathyarchaeota archaeon]
MSEVTRRHKEKAPKRLGFAVIVCSTSRYQKLMAEKKVEDESGDLIAELLEQHGHTVIFRRVVPDDESLIKKNLKEALRLQNVDAVMLCGGTGISSMDVTIETVKPLLEKELHGFGEIFRWLSYQTIGSAAVMTRAVAGVMEGKGVFCIPGSPQAVKLCLEKLIIPEVGHIIFHAREC